MMTRSRRIPLHLRREKSEGLAGHRVGRAAFAGRVPARDQTGRRSSSHPVRAAPRKDLRETYFVAGGVGAASFLGAAFFAGAAFLAWAVFFTVFGLAGAVAGGVGDGAAAGSAAKAAAGIDSATEIAMGRLGAPTSRARWHPPFLNGPSSPD